MMKNGQEKDDVRNGAGLEKIYCMTCGKPMGKAVTGNLAGHYCDKCRNEYTLDFREAGSTLKHAKYEITMIL